MQSWRNPLLTDVSCARIYHSVVAIRKYRFYARIYRRLSAPADHANPDWPGGHMGTLTPGHLASCHPDCLAITKPWPAVTSPGGIPIHPDSPRCIHPDSSRCMVGSFFIHWHFLLRFGACSADLRWLRLLCLSHECTGFFNGSFRCSRLWMVPHHRWWAMDSISQSGDLGPGKRPQHEEAFPWHHFGTMQIDIAEWLHCWDASQRFQIIAMRHMGLQQSRT